jgi:multidrug efflux system membrane fusion protein
MKQSKSHGQIIGAVVALAIAATGTGFVLTRDDNNARAENPPAAQQAPQAVPVSVAVVETRDTMIWEEFSGRLEAIDRVEIRPRVSGMIQNVHFREGDLVKKGDLLISLDPAPYEAETAQAEAQVAALEARVALAKADLERGQTLSGERVVSQRDLDQRTNASREAQANLKGAQAALQSAKLRLDYTKVRAPVTGRVGKLEVTPGNLVGEGPAAPVLTTLVSVDPIYASFNADERIVLTALKALGTGPQANAQVERIPVQIDTVVSNGTPIAGKLQLIDNRVDAASGTVRVRGVFENPSGLMMHGQFARVRMGQAKTKPTLLVSERAIGTDQDKKFVMVVDQENKVGYREVVLGPASDGLRVVTSGLSVGERIVVNGLQRVRPGAVVAPEVVAMDGKPVAQAQNSGEQGVTQR